MAQALDPNKAQVKGIQEYDSAVTNQMADKVVIYDADKSKISSSTLQDIKELYDKATIITQTGTSPNVRNDSTFVIVNNASEVRLTLNSAMIKGADGTDSSSLSSGLLVTVFNASSRSHVVLYGNGNANSISLGANTTSQFYWTGSYWCLHSSVVDSLTVTGSANFGGTISGSGFDSALANYVLKSNLGVQYKRIYAGTHNANITDLNLTGGLYHLIGYQGNKMFDMQYFCNGTSVSYCVTTNNMNVLSVNINAIYINTALDLLIIDKVA